MGCDSAERGALMFVTFLLAGLVLVLSFTLLKTVSDGSMPGYDKILILDPDDAAPPTPTPGPRPTPTPEEHRLFENGRGMFRVLHA